MDDKFKIEFESEVDNQNEYTIENILEDFDSSKKYSKDYLEKSDYLIAISSGIIAGLIDVFYVGEMDLVNAKSIVSDRVKEFVISTAQKLSKKEFKEDDITSAVSWLEKHWPIPADGNTIDFGGGKQHHLRDFTHHPSIIGLVCSIVSQFTGETYGTDKDGNFIHVKFSKKSQEFIGKSVVDKIYNGTIVWFVHLVSDMAGSSATSALSGGTGIPGPILSLIKELSSLPIFKTLDTEDKVSLFLSKLFNGTLFIKRDENGKIIPESILKIDFRAELGILKELGRASTPVILNEAIVRGFYLIKQLRNEIKVNNIRKIEDFSKVNIENIKPYNCKKLKHMLTISFGVMETIDVGEAFIFKNWTKVNIPGIGRFAVLLGSEVIEILKTNNVKDKKEIYNIINENIYRNAFYKENKLNEFNLTEVQVEILYNIEALKVENDINLTKNEKVIEKKKEWLKVWKTNIQKGFPTFMQNENAILNWFTREKLQKEIIDNDYSKRWFKLVMFEAMLFEPYYPLTIEKSEDGKGSESKKYEDIIKKYNKDLGDEYINNFYNIMIGDPNFILNLRKSYNKIFNKISEQNKTIIKNSIITASIAGAVATLASTAAPAIAPILVGGKFVGLHGIALTNACLAYLGGGAISVGGLGMAGGTMMIAGGGALLTVGIGSTATVFSALSKKEVEKDFVKLIVNLKEIIAKCESNYELVKDTYEKLATTVRNLKISKSELEFEIELGLLDNKEKDKENVEKVKNLDENIKLLTTALDIIRKDIIYKE